MSYAAVAAKGPKQSPEEAYVKNLSLRSSKTSSKRIAYVRQLEHEDRGPLSLYTFERQRAIRLPHCTHNKQAIDLF
ncbi:hypothetical protein MMC34_006112 [Xylographa carneopallida]|nr:hypothetical protein [Xylographa carneopallida]